MNVFGIAGWSGSGKTTLIERLLPSLASRGLRVSVVKHAHHRFDIDQPGKDSHRFREAGSHEVLVSSPARWALMREHRGVDEPALAELLSHLSACDLVLVEGFKREPMAKLEVHRPALGKALLWPDDPHIVAVASDTASDAASDAASDVTLDGPEGRALPRFHLDDIDAIAAFIVSTVRDASSAGPAVP